MNNRDCRRRVRMTLWIVCLLLPCAGAAPPRAVPKGKLPDDCRLGPPRTLDSYAPFTPVASPAAWEQRADRLRRQVLVATGLWPMPTRVPPQAVVHGRIERDRYTVEKVFFESVPGHFVSGNLYRPAGRPGRLPAVLSPHGHWPEGRFHDHGPEQVRREIAEGAERFEVGGRHPLQARCVQLARMGCVVFHYDMIGYADSVQLEHRPGVREAMNTADGWGYFSPQAELRLQNIMGLQTLNSVRALDFLLSLADVDPARVAVTGASGGGTQTFLLCAIDDRPAVAFPAVMVSTGMQGGCTCENASYLRIGAGNIDLAARTAPRPLGLTAANDWTRELASKGLPDLKQLYAMLGYPDRVGATILTQFGHNYNSVSRTAMYNWLNRHLQLGLEEPVIEEDYHPLTRAEMSVWTDAHPRPTGDQVGDAHERHVVHWLTDDAERQLAALVPDSPDELAEYRRVVGGAFDVILDRPGAGSGSATGSEDAGVSSCSYTVVSSHPIAGHDCELATGLVTDGARGAQLPMLLFRPSGRRKPEVVIWIEGRGKESLLDGQDAPAPAIDRLLDAGFTVAGVDLFGQGEFVADGQRPGKTGVVHYGKGDEPWNHYAGYTFGYNRPLFVEQVHDILTVVDCLRSSADRPARVHLVGLAGAGPLVAAARSLAGDAVAKTAVDTNGFRFAALTRFDDPMFLPGAAKYHDLPGLLALCAPHPLMVVGETEQTARVSLAAYRAADQSGQLRLAPPPADVAAAVVAWISE